MEGQVGWWEGGGQVVGDELGGGGQVGGGGGQVVGVSWGVRGGGGVRYVTINHRIINISLYIPSESLNFSYVLKVI